MKRILKFNDIYTLQKDYVDHYQTRLSVVNINNLDNHVIFTIDPDAITVFFRGRDLKLSAYMADISADRTDYMDGLLLRSLYYLWNRLSTDEPVKKITIDNQIVDLNNHDSDGYYYYDCSDDDTIHCLLIWGEEKSEDGETWNSLIELGLTGGTGRVPKGWFILNDIPPRSVVVLPKCLTKIPKSNTTYENYRNFRQYFNQEDFNAMMDIVDNSSDITLEGLIEDCGEEIGTYKWNILLFCVAELLGLTYNEFCPNVYITADELPTLENSYSFANCNLCFTNLNVVSDAIYATYWKDLNIVDKNKYISIVAIYDVIDTSSPTTIVCPDAYMVILGNKYLLLNENLTLISIKTNLSTTQYTFSTTGEHIIYVKPYDDSIVAVSPMMFYSASAQTTLLRLRRVIVPKNITYLGSECFKNNTLISVTFLSETPATVESSVFSNNVIIYVPASAVNAYKTAWTDYASLIQAISD